MAAGREDLQLWAPGAGSLQKRLSVIIFSLFPLPSLPVRNTGDRDKLLSSLQRELLVRHDQGLVNEFVRMGLVLQIEIWEVLSLGFWW